ncbi:MAG TPA: CHAT domain-containing protein [Solirubrobacteraceae bacterium]|nr:CHAT domain-containing protein [Solirubrobacteraceae bacterium]
MGKRLLRINPGNLPESEELRRITDEVGRVQARASRERAGAVAPGRQLRALREILAKLQSAIEAVMAAARSRQGNMLSARNSFELAIAIRRYAGLAHLWLTLTADMQNLPDRAPPHRPVSALRSHQERVTIVNTVGRYDHVAKDSLRNLAELRVSREANLRVDQLNIELFLEWVGIALAATDMNSRFPPAPLNDFLRELTAIRVRADLSQQSQSLQARYWQVRAAVEQRSDDDEVAARSIREWTRLMPDDVDAQLQLRLELIQLASSDAERLEHMTALRRIAERPGMGALFSRERLGRLSGLRDVFWAIPARVDESSPYAVAIIEEAFAAYGVWLYGTPVELYPHTISILTAWRGRGHLSFMLDGTRRVRAVEIPDALLPTFAGDAERLKPLAQVMRPMEEFLDAAVAPLLDDAELAGETRLVAGGGASLLPLLATTVNEQPLGARGTVAYAHPNPSVVAAPPSTTPFDLLVTDRSFGADSRVVVESWEASSETTETKIEFDSSATAGVLAAESLRAALETSRRALVFCHVENPMFHAAQGGIFLGGDQFLSPEAIAGLSLRGLEELVVIGCGSGRDNFFIGGVSVAHAAAVAGARDILYTLWTISHEHGARFAVALIDARGKGVNLAGFLASKYAEDHTLASVYAMLRP